MKRFTVCGCLLAMVLLAGVAIRVWAADPVDPGIGDPYPLERCVVADTPLDEDQQIITDEGREIRLCCDDCVNRFFQESSYWLGEIDNQIIKHQQPFYPLKKCIVDGTPLDKTAIDYAFRNRLFRLCSEKCLTKVEQSPAKYFGELDLAVVEKQKDNYPLTKCVVSDKPLGDDVFDYVVANQLVRLAGVDQLDGFNKNPGKYLAKVQAAAKEKAKQAQK